MSACDATPYLWPALVETEADFMRLLPRRGRVGDLRAFYSFMLPVPASVDVTT